MAIKVEFNEDGSIKLPEAYKKRLDIDSDEVVKEEYLYDHEKDRRISNESSFSVWQNAYEDYSNSVLQSLKNGKVWTDLEFKNHIKSEQLLGIPGFKKLICLSELSFKPYPHQINTAIKALSQMRGRVILADQVGLGKTIEAGIILKELFVRNLAKTALILTPPSLINQWREEELIPKFNEYFKENKDVDGWGYYNKIICSLNTAKRKEHADEILKYTWDIVIIDEAHKLKNRRTLSWKFINSIKKKYFLLLTATPLQNDLRELYNIITLLRPGLLGSPFQFYYNFVKESGPKTHKQDIWVSKLEEKYGDDPEFRARYQSKSYKSSYGRITYRDIKNTAKLRDLIFKSMIRNRWSDTKIPKTKRWPHKVMVHPTKQEQEFYDGVSNFIRLWISESRTNPQFVHYKGLMWMNLINFQKQLCSSISSIANTIGKLSQDPDVHPKLHSPLEQIFGLSLKLPRTSKVEELMQLIEKLDPPIIIFTEYRETLNYLARLISPQYKNLILFHGGLSRNQKKSALEKFKADKTILLSTDTGAEGLNLQFCNQLINFDLPWNPQRIEQRIGRIHRLTQEKDVEIYNFATKETVEEYILTVLHDKLKLFELIVGELDAILSNLEDEDFEKRIEEIVLLPKARQKIEFDRFGIEIDSAYKAYQETLLLDKKVLDENARV